MLLIFIKQPPATGFKSAAALERVFSIKLEEELFLKFFSPLLIIQNSPNSPRALDGEQVLVFLHYTLTIEARGQPGHLRKSAGLSDLEIFSPPPCSSLGRRRGGKAKQCHRYPIRMVPDSSSD